MTRTLVSGLLTLAACGVNPAYDDLPTAPSPDPGASTGLALDPTTGSTGTLEAPTLDPSTGALLPASSSTDTTTGDPDTTATADATTDQTTDATTVGPPMMEEHLQFYDNADCDAPLWCQEGMMPSPARTHAQLCFRPASAPPYHLRRIGWLIADTHGDLGSTSNLAVYTGDDDGPVDKVWEVSLGPPEVSDAYPHAFVLDDPLVLETPVFCVGLSGGANGPPPSGLGVALDTSAQVAGRSYFAVDPGASCTTDGWTDVEDLPFGPKGTWCIDATILGH